MSDRLDPLDPRTPTEAHRREPDTLAPPSSPRSLHDDLSTQEMRFQNLRGLTFAEVLHPSERNEGEMAQIQVLRELISISKKSMEKMNHLSKGIPTDSAQSLLDMFTHEGAQVILLYADVMEHGILEKKIVGYDLHFIGEENFPDRADIPRAVLDGHDAIRSIRLFIDPEAPLHGGIGAATGKLIDRLVEIADGKRIIGKVLVGPESMAPQWLAAKSALEARGFESTGLAAAQTFLHPDGTERVLYFEWYVHPTFSEDGARKFAAARERLEAIERPYQRRLAATSAHFPSKGARLAYYGPDQLEAFYLAALYPQDSIVHVKLPGDAPPKTEKKRINLASTKEDGTWSALGPESMTGVLSIDLLKRTHDQFPGSFDERMESLFDKQVDMLNVGGKLVLWETESAVLPSRQKIEDELSKRGLRLLYSGPVLGDEAARKNTFAIIGEKVGPHEGVRLVEVRSEIIDTPLFLQLNDYGVISAETGEVIRRHTLAKRPNPTIELFVVSQDPGGDWHALVKTGYPRPILTHKSDESLDGSTPFGWSVEQIGAIKDIDRVNTPEGMRAVVEEILRERGATPPEDIEEVVETFRYLTSAGRVDEEVIAIILRVKHEPDIKKIEHGYSNLSSSGVVQPTELRQIFAGCQVGTLLNTGLERLAYRFCTTHGIPVGPWIGTQVNLQTQHVEEAPQSSLTRLLNLPHVKTFVKLPDQIGKYYEIHRGTFEERDKAGAALSTVNLEFVEPSEQTGLGNNTGVVVPVMKVVDKSGKERIYCGFETRSLPAVQEHSDTSLLTCLPAFRLSKNVSTISDLFKELGTRMKSDFRADTLQLSVLGGEFPSSIGVMKEMVRIVLAEVDAKTAAASDLSWVPLDEFSRHMDKLVGGNSITGVYRTLHALKLLKT